MTTNLALASYKATGSSTSRTLGARAAEFYNVLDYGADPTGVNDCATAIRAALAAMYGSTLAAGTIFFPPGIYKVLSQIDISTVSGTANASRIIGSGKAATVIRGTVDNGFTFTRPNATGGIGLICDMTIENNSTKLATGALRFHSNSGTSIENVTLKGNIGLDCAWNSYGLNLLNVEATPVLNKTCGTVGIVSNGSNLFGGRPVGGTDIYGMCAGTNGHSWHGFSMEVCNIGLALGVFQGWASAGTISGNVLTIPLGAELSPVDNASSQVPKFQTGDLLYGTGVNGITPWGKPLDSGLGLSITGQSTNTNANGYAGNEGTYTLSASPGNISVAVPMLTRRLSGLGSGLAASTFADFQPEGTLFPVYVNGINTCVIGPCTLTGAPGEGPSDTGVGAENGLNAYCGIYMRNAAASTFQNVIARAATSHGGLYFTNASWNDLVFSGCAFTATASAVDTGGKIDNGAGGAGTTMTISGAVTGGFVEVGMTITGAGVTADTEVTASGLTDVTLTGTGGAGTYRVNNSQNVTTTLTAVGGPAYRVQPTGSGNNAGLTFVGMNPPSLGLVYADLPGEAGVNTNIIRYEGMEYSIIDGAKSGGGAAAFGDATQGGGSNHYKGRYVGSAAPTAGWIRVG